MAAILIEEGSEVETCPICRQPLTDGNDHDHYPLAIGDYVETALTDGESAGPEAYADAVRRIDRMIECPAYAYRPVPAALRFHRSRARYRWCIGGNRSSKSHSCAQEVYWYATGTHPFKRIETPNVGWYCTLTWEMVGQILWKKMEKLLSHLTPGDDYEIVWHNKGRRVPEMVRIKVLNSKTGAEAWSEIIFKAYEQGADSFQGTERRYIANDEQFPEDVFYEQVTRIGSEAPFDFWCAMTPLKPQPWLEEQLEKKTEADGWEVFKYPLDDNRVSVGGFIPDGEIDAAIDTWPEEMQATRRSGDWASFVGVVYKTYNRRIHVVPENMEHLFLPYHQKFKKLIIPLGDSVTGGIDFGGNNPFVFLWVWYSNAWDAYYLFDEYYWENERRGPRLLSHHAKEILERTEKRWQTTLKSVWADHDVQDRFELANAGLHSSPAQKDVRAGIEYMQSLFKIHAHMPHPWNKDGNTPTGRPRLFIAERCVNTIKEIAGYRYPEGTDTRDPADEPLKKDDHSCDALRYALYSESVGGRHGPYVGGASPRRF